VISATTTRTHSLTLSVNLANDYAPQNHPLGFTGCSVNSQPNILLNETNARSIYSILSGNQ